MSTKALALMTVAVFSAAALAQPVSPCKPDDVGTLTSLKGKSELRVIRGTLSPGKRYAIAWATEEGKSGKDYELITHDDYKARYAGGDSETFLVRLGDAKVLTELKGEHLGDQARYNHRIARAIWSLDEGWMIAVNDEKWDTSHADAYHFGTGGVSAPLDLLKVCLAAEHRYFERTPIKGSFDNYAQSLNVKSVANDGTMAALCQMQVIKEDDAYSFAIHVKLAATGNALTAKIQSVRRCADDDDKGDCASPDIPD